MMSSKKRAYFKGHIAEYAAACYLMLKGYRILKRRCKTPVGEIDLIVSKKNMIVFVEVKSRSCLQQGLEAITPASQKRICRAAQYILARPSYLNNVHKSNNFKSQPCYDFRFDVIVVVSFRFHHIQHAWNARF